MACGGGTKTDVVSETSITTLGQELQDLDKAYKDGIITEKEYNKAKEKLIKKKPNKMISAVHRSKLDRRMCLYYRQGG
jgi:hypothetical protein